MCGRSRKDFPVGSYPRLQMGSCEFHCDVRSCVLFLYTVMGWGAMSCICMLLQGGLSCPVSVYCDGVGCHALCLYTVTVWGVMSYVCILRRGGVSCPLSIYCDGGGVMFCACIL